MITFRLGDAMPVSLRHEWERLKKIDDDRERQRRLEAYLDLGLGDCCLRDARCASAVEEALLKFDGKRYRLAAWVVMPNHVHVLVEPWAVTLGRLCKAWKGASARAINKLLGSSGKLWQEDYWDRRIRNEEHFRKALRYVESNPVKAGLASTAPEWAFSSANPRRQWTVGSRYAAAHLVRGEWEKTSEVE